MPRYYKRFRDEPRGDSHDDRGASTWYLEVGSDRYVTRQIEVYENGTVLKYDDELVFDEYGGLADQPIEVQEYAGFEISADHFERAWSSTRASNRRRWLARSSLFSGTSPKRAARRIATLAFGALPATALFLFALQHLYFDVMRALGRGGAGAIVEQGLEFLISVGWIVLAALGTIGCWRIAVQTRFVGRTNFYFLTAGLLAIWPILLRVLAMWSESDPFRALSGTWPGFLLFLIPPVLTAFTYLLAMVFLYARGRDE